MPAPDSPGLEQEAPCHSPPPWSLSAIRRDRAKRPQSSSNFWSPRWCRIPRPPRVISRDDLAITFTGGRKYNHPRETTAFNAQALQVGEEEDGAHRRGARHAARPSSTISARCTANGRTARRSRAIAMSTASSCRGGKIVQMDVWNDSAERILHRTVGSRHKPSDWLAPWARRSRGCFPPSALVAGRGYP